MASKHSRSFFDFKTSAFLKSGDAKTSSFPLYIKIIISVLVLSLVVACVFISVFFIQGNNHKKLLADARKVFNSAPSGEAIKTLAKENEDIKGWLRIDGTEIDCAVCHGEDNQFYTNHNQLGKKSRYGALFLSSDDSFERNGNDKNIVIYGNNMKDGTMFGSLKSYQNLRFYKAHPFINLYYGDQSETYAVFAVMLLPPSNSNYEFYSPLISSFANDADFESWYKECCERSIISTTVEVQNGDDILTLITSASDFEGARFAVMAKKLDEWGAARTDVSGAKTSSKIKYPVAWYKKHGIDYPY